MQITAFYIFHITPKHQYSALVKMAYAGFLLRRAKGCSFAKIMGSGGGSLGFGLSPNFKLYASLMVWDSLEQMKKFEASNRMFAAYTKISSSVDKFYGQAFQVHGKWDGAEPFTAFPDPLLAGSKIIVLTRAKIRWSQIRNFWRFVPSTSEALTQIDGRLFSIGVGELPLIYQATLSIWETQEHMRAYAYKNPQHLEAIKKTKELNWYSEELFGRFYLLPLP